jgi:GntR family transcriptional regulator
MQIDVAIDRSSYLPLYAQVMDAIQSYIEQGPGEPGEQLPGEPELCRMFDVSRTVIRQALRELEQEGLILRLKGKGTFVAEPKIQESLVAELTGFFQDMQARGHAPVSRVLRQEIVAAPRRIAGLLQLKIGAPIIQIDRVRYVEGEPIVLVSTYLPYELCPGLLKIDLTQASLYAYLEEQYGIVIARGRRTLEAVAATEEEAHLLGVQAGDPLVLIDSVSYLAGGTPIEYYHALHRGDRSRFEVELVRVREHGSGREVGSSALVDALKRSQDSTKEKVA